MSTESSKTATADTPLRKFMFDLSFDDAAVVHRAVERKPVLMKPEQVDELKHESFDEGYVAGRDIGLKEHDAQFAVVMERFATSVEQIAQTLGSVVAEQEKQARTLAVAAIKKLMPSLAARGGLEEIENLLTETIKEMAREPRLVIRVHADDFDKINERVQTIATQRAYPGKVIVLADGDIGSGDCRIEWADGGVVRDTPATMAVIIDSIQPSTGA